MCVCIPACACMSLHPFACMLKYVLASVRTYVCEPLDVITPATLPSNIPCQDPALKAPVVHRGGGREGGRGRRRAMEGKGEGCGSRRKTSKVEGGSAGGVGE